MMSEDLFSTRSLMILFMAGLLGTLTNIASFFQIKYTSPLTHNVSGTSKACVQSILAWFIYRNPLSTKAVVGLAMSIVGGFAYGKIRYDEGEAAKKAKARDMAAKELLDSSEAANTK